MILCLNPVFSSLDKAFLYDFDARKSYKAQDILNTRKKSVSKTTQKLTFLMLMLLRRFHFLNYLLFTVIQGQGLTRQAFHTGVSKELVNRDTTLSTRMIKTYSVDFTILIPIIAIQHDNNVWTNGEEFRPERWVDVMVPEVVLARYSLLTTTRSVVIPSKA
ncbi:hypothetical protein BT96DRAFT_1001501 [Gymnopus androsaceus JB14]|uniref:Uncharacterized protein n=1 Tax=Gymnopus androsaceus JB14 TaxID=1447944 RepID=A0A6A4H1P0_9AGAR|nr:hypothetical protein BT96DRAFT_1001501 [Gymnopus androsaceus JB14]